MASTNSKSRVLENRVPRAVLQLEARPRAFDRAAPLARDRAVVVVVAGERGLACVDAIKGVVGRRVDVVDVRDRGRSIANDIGALVDLSAIDAPSDVDGALALAKDALFVAQSARASLLESAKAGGAFYLVVTSLSSTNPVAAAMHGLLKTASLEWPSVACSVVEVSDCDVASTVAEELRAGFLDVEVVRNRGGRFVPVVIERAVEATSARNITRADVVLGSGGARGVTATTLLALANESQCGFVLLGRTPIVDEPSCCASAGDEASIKRALVEDAKRNGRSVALAKIGEEAKSILAVREIRAFLDELERAGSRVLYRAVDVRDVAAVKRACDEGRAQLGAITAIVHGAGVLADKRIEDKTREQVDRVMDTKVLGLRALVEATQNDPVDVVALFSSVAGRFGNVGQVDYAMANEALNEMANEIARELSRKRPGVVVKSFNWGPWEGGMVTPALKKLFEERGVRVLSHEDGAQHFVDELRANDGCVEVVFGGALDGSESKAHEAAANGTTTRVHLDARSHPFFADHALQGTVVLPAVGAIALLAAATGSTSFADVRVLRGVQLPRFFDGGHDVVAHVDGDRCTLALVDDAAPRYRARIASSDVDANALRDRFARELAGAGAFRFSSSSIYAPNDALLFHGPRFHLIESVESAGDAGLIAHVRGSLARGWGDGFVVDVGALDAALQAVLLWGRHRTGGAYLPTSIARVTSMRGPSDARLTCLVRGVVCDELKARADVLLVDDNDVVTAVLEGVELHRVSDDAFKNARTPNATVTPATTTNGALA